jgi:hypothetical protein
MRALLPILLFATSALGVDCTLRPDSPGFHLDQWSGPLHSLRLSPTRQDEIFSPELSLLQGDGPLVLEIDYCGGFSLAGDFSQLPVWEFGGIGWAMIKNPDDEDSLLGNFLGPPSDFEILRDPIQATTVELGDNAFRTTGIFDTSELETGKYVIGLTGTYVFAEPSFEDPEFRVREDVLFEYGFPLTIVPTPEPSSALPLAWGLIAYIARRRHYR